MTANDKDMITQVLWILIYIKQNGGKSESSKQELRWNEQVFIKFNKTGGASTLEQNI